MKFSSYLRSDTIFLDVEIDSYEDVLKFIAEKFSTLADIDSSKILDTLHKREEAGSTYLDNAVAYPHGRLDDYDDLIIIFVRTNREVELPKTVINNKPMANCFFSVLASSNDAGLYLKSIRAVAQVVQQHSDKLQEATDFTMLTELFSTIDIEENHTITAKDLMVDVISTTEDTSMADALNTLSQNNICRLVVTPQNNRKIVGHITFDTLLKYSVPEYALHMNTLSFTESFDPLQEIWQKENSSIIKDIMEDCENITVTEDTKYFEVLLIMAKNSSPAVYVVDVNREIVGIIGKMEVLHKLIRP